MKIKLIYHLAELLHESAKSVVSKTQGGLHIYDAIAVYMLVLMVMAEILHVYRISVREGASMNKVVLLGRLTKDPEVRYSTGEKETAVARYTVAVDRRFKRDGEPTADFIPCVVFGRSSEFAEKYFHQGMRVSISGHIQTGSYTNKDGVKVYTTVVIVEEQEFAESKSESKNTSNPVEESSADDGFMNLTDEYDDELPFH